MHPIARFTIGSLLVIAAGAAPAAADVMFTDTTFNLAHYAASPTYTSDPRQVSSIAVRPVRCSLPRRSPRREAPRLIRLLKGW
jgi:hypothetical protein